MTMHAISQMPGGAVLVVGLNAHGDGRPLFELRPLGNQTETDIAERAAELLAYAGNRPGGWPAAGALLAKPEAAEPPGRVKLLTLVCLADAVGKIRMDVLEHEAPTEAGLPARAGLLAMAEQLALATNAALPEMRLRIATLESMLAGAQQHAGTMELRHKQAIAQRDSAIEALELVRALAAPRRDNTASATGRLRDIHRGVSNTLDAVGEPPDEAPPAPRTPAPARKPRAKKV